MDKEKTNEEKIKELKVQVWDLMREAQNHNVAIQGIQKALDDKNQTIAKLEKEGEPEKKKHLKSLEQSN